MRHRRETRPSPEKNYSMLWLMLLILIPLLAIVNIFLSAQVSDLGFKMAASLQQKNALLEYNQNLETAIFEKSSLTSILFQAENWGYNNENKYVHLSSEPQVAINNN